MVTVIITGIMTMTGVNIIVTIMVMTIIDAF
jgi:hypothetical protein